jgi:hypothetical protein
MRKVYAAWLALVFVVPGCEYPEPPIGGGGGSGGSGPVCTASWICEQTQPCKTFHMRQDGQLHEQSMHGASGGTLEDVRCVLRGLRDGTPGKYAFVLDTPSMPGFLVDFHTIDVLSSGNAVRTVNPFRDLSPTTISRAHLTRQPAAFFDACLALPLSAELFVCLTTWSAGGASGCPICPAP